MADSNIFEAVRRINRLKNTLSRPPALLCTMASHIEHTELHCKLQFVELHVWLSFCRIWPSKKLKHTLSTLNLAFEIDFELA